VMADDGLQIAALVFNQLCCVGQSVDPR
jgi:hypothetical protein